MKQVWSILLHYVVDVFVVLEFQVFLVEQWQGLCPLVIVKFGTLLVEPHERRLDVIIVPFVEMVHLVGVFVVPTPDGLRPIIGPVETRHCV